MKRYMVSGLLFCTLVQEGLAQTPLSINELMASNVLTVADSAGEYDDWLEIYNPNSHAVNLAGYYLSDDPSQLTRWQVPGDRPEATAVPARGFLLLWADNQTDQGPLHAAFKLSREAEAILLVEPNGTTVVDSISYESQIADVSYGRFPDGASEWRYFPEPSPGGANKNGYAGFAEPPTIAQASGFYPGPITVSIDPPLSGGAVFYTLDGAEPDGNSRPYSGPIPISQTTVLRGRTIRSGLAPSAVATEVYFIDTPHSLPVVSFATDPENLFDPSAGIYTNPEEHGRQWERRVTVQFFDQGVPRFRVFAGLRIQGNTGRKMAKKSFRLFFRNGYGQERLAYNFFDDTPVQTFKNLVLRAGYDDDLRQNNGTLLRDPLVTELWRRLGYPTSHSRLALLYLNDQFWGIYDIREDINQHFIRDYFKYENFDIIRLRWGFWELDYGQKDDWEGLLRFFRNNDFHSDAMFSEAITRLDIENFTALQALSHATQYRSWTYGAFAVREKQPAAKWYWTIWDMDRSYTDLNWNGFYYYDHPDNEYWINLIAQKLLQNQTYRRYFVNRLSDLLNTIFLPDRVLPVLDSLATVVKSEIPAEASRWGSSVQLWRANVDSLRDFIRKRPAVVRRQMADYFGLAAPVRITLDVPNGGGTLQVNTIRVDRFPWSGLYYHGFPIEIVAHPFDGYRFAGWSDPALPDTRTVTVDPAGDYSLSATFVPLATARTEIIVPGRAIPGSMLPLVTRIRDRQGRIDHLMNAAAEVRTNGASGDTTFQIKRGAGSVVMPIAASSSFTLTVQNSDIPTAQKIIAVDNNRPTISYAGTLPLGDITWEPASDRLITGDLTIPQGCRLTVRAGTWIRLRRHVNITVRGTLAVEGTADDPVVFTSEDWREPWGGLEFFNTVATFQYCFFLNGGADPQKGWAHSNRQPLLFAKENSSLSLNNCFLLDSPGKALGATDSKVDVSECLTAFVFHGGEYHRTLLHYRDSHIMNIPNDDGIFEDEDSDGFHIDYLYPYSNEYSTIENCFLITGKDDAVDHHGSRLRVANCWLEDWMHEGVAASGGDTIKVFNTVVRNCEQGIETGWTDSGVAVGPHVFVDHCVVTNNGTGLRFGDSYDWSYRGHMTVTNTIMYGNDDNIRNYLNSTHAPQPGGIEISYSMTNDEDYDDSPYCITGVPQFDEDYFLLPGSPGVGRGMNGTNMGRIDSTALLAGTTSTPERFVLEQNYPNPFNATTTIGYALPQPATVRLSFYNVFGQRLLDLVDEETQPAGRYRIRFAAGEYSSGIYFYRMRAQFQDGTTLTRTKKLLIVK